MSAPTLRAATPDDEQAMLDLLDAEGLPRAGFERCAVRLVAVRGGRVLGVAGLEDHGSGAERALLLRSVAVRRDARGAGVGAALVTALLDAAGDTPVALLTETAEAWFPRFGFTEVDRDRLPAALEASPELRDACAVTARAFLRSGRRAD